MSLLPIAPAGHILEELAQGLAGGLLAQRFSPGLGGQQLSRRQLRRLERQTAQQDWNPVKDRGQAEVGVAGGVADPADHREGGPGDGD